MHPIPYYDDIHAANKRKREAYTAELERRYTERLKFAEGLAQKAKGQPEEALAAWTAHVRSVRRDLAEALGGFAKAGPDAPQWAMGARPVSRNHPLATLWYRTEGVREPIELLVLRAFGGPRQSPTLVCVPGTGAETGLGLSKEGVAEAYGAALAARGLRVVIPDLPGIRRFCPARNKALLLEGKTLLGEIVDDLARLYDGRIELTDSPLGGLRATLILPATADAALPR